MNKNDRTQFLIMMSYLLFGRTSRESVVVYLVGRQSWVRLHVGKLK